MGFLLRSYQTCHPTAIQGKRVFKATSRYGIPWKHIFVGYLKKVEEDLVGQLLKKMSYALDLLVHFWQTEF